MPKLKSPWYALFVVSLSLALGSIVLSNFLSNEVSQRMFNISFLGFLVSALGGIVSHVLRVRSGKAPKQSRADHPHAAAGSGSGVASSMRGVFAGGALAGTAAASMTDWTKQDSMLSPSAFEPMTNIDGTPMMGHGIDINGDPYGLPRSMMANIDGTPMAGLGIDVNGHAYGATNFGIPDSFHNPMDISDISATGMGGMD